MPDLKTQGIKLHYETFGDAKAPPVLMLAGLGGAGMTWGGQVKRFAERYHVILPDHRGTGQSSRPAGGYTIAQHASDFAALLRHLDTGPVHVVGSSTGGAIAQLMALDHGDLVRTITMTSSFARPNAYVRREFAVRRYLVEKADLKTIYSAYALFLFATTYAARHPDVVQAWVDRAAAGRLERQVSLKRIDMVMAHDVVSRLGSIRHPACVVGGDHDLCTTLLLSEEVFHAIPGAEMNVITGGGHMIHFEHEERYFNIVSEFIDRHRG